MPSSHDSPRAHQAVPLFIDDVKHELLEGNNVTGAQLRALVPVPSDRDLWLEVSGPRDDVLIRPDQEYEVKPGSQFYTAPSTINPGGR